MSKFKCSKRNYEMHLKIGPFDWNLVLATWNLLSDRAPLDPCPVTLL